MSNIEVKDNHLYISYEYYSTSIMGYTSERKIIPLNEIKCIEAIVGSRGGMHSWSIKNKQGKDLVAFGRKHNDVLEKVEELLPDVEYIENIESGGVAC